MTAKAATLIERLKPTLKPTNAARANAWVTDLLAAATGLARLEAALARPAMKRFLAAIMDDAPFLRGLILDDPVRLLWLLETDPDASLDHVCRAAAEAWRDGAPDAMATLRRCRSEIALLVALADLGRVWDVDTVMVALSRFADAALNAAASLALAEEHRSGTIRLADPDDPQIGSGWIIFAMGKLGARELNYSSDIDLISLFEPGRLALADGAEPGKLYVRLTKRLVHLLHEHTADGYVFRVDLRLRPDPGSTAVAIATDAALNYYEALGQNWERAALIKARPVAGDIEAGTVFLDELRPYLWRKYLDYAAIADIHSIKRQIHDYRGHAVVAIAGHNLKLGRGGIREIEFFVQTQQLIAGGRNPSLRGRRTIDMLAELAAGGWIEDNTAAELTEAYRALRSIEHRLQMIADEQTHSLPSDNDGLDRVARLMGLANGRRLAETLRPVLETVESHYAELFESAPGLSSTGGSLVFTGDDDDPDTLQTLSGLGFAEPGAVSAAIRGWHYGRYPATRSAAARERLTELMPALLEALAKTASPDAAFLAFDRFLSRLPAGVQLFALLISNPSLLGLLATILGTAPRLADIVTRRPHVLDAVIEPAFFGTVPDKDTLTEHLRRSLAQAASYEDGLDRARIFGDEQRFLIGVRVLVGAIDARRAGFAYADLADLLVAEVFTLAETEFRSVHGVMPKGRAAVVAMGKFGGREMTAASDLDLILLYDFANNATGSDGDKPLSGSPYYARLTQRLVAALSAPTAEGRLYDVDFRLRPSGNAGPLATGAKAFAEYQEKEAWTWEHMALTRARPVAGDPSLGAETTKLVRRVLTRPRETPRLAGDVREMRALIEQEKGGAGHWDIKQAQGGLIDIEFIAQFLQLRHAAEHPKILAVETEVALTEAAKAKVLNAGDAEVLLGALRLYQSLIQIIRLCAEEPLQPDKVPPGLLELLARTVALPDFARLDAHLRETEADVRRLFVKLIGTVSAEPLPRR